ncbi:single-stranded DNA-binding protein [Escherichia coli]|nr:single-stranded DNA-binding protein [Escherichia coli]
MAVRGINKVILVGRPGKRSGSPLHPQRGAQWQTCRWPHQKAGVTNRRGEMREQTEWHRVVLFGKLAEVAGEYLRKGAQVYIEGQLRTRSWEDNGITRYVTEILVKTTGTMQMLGRVAGAQTQPEEGQQFSGQSQPEPQAEAGTKKGGAKTKGRGRKATQPESQPQPPESDDYGFSDDTRSERLTVTTAPSCAGASPER